MAYDPVLPHLPVNLNFMPDLPPFDSYEAYPFYPRENYDAPHLFQYLEEFIHHKSIEGLHIRPLDFTNYTIDRLRVHYGGPASLRNHPLYFLFHWTPHPSKGSKDMVQKTTASTVNCSYWKEFTQQRDLGNGYIRKYVLEEETKNGKIVTGGRPGYWLNEYLLHSYDRNRHDAEPYPHLKKSPWSIVELYEKHR